MSQVNVRADAAVSCTNGIRLDAKSGPVLGKRPTINRDLVWIAVYFGWFNLLRL